MKIKVYASGARKKFEDWMARGGVKVWRNINLSNPGAGPMFTPAFDENGSPYKKPSWRVDNGEVITDINQFQFLKDSVVFKRVRISIRRASGLNYCLTDASQRRVDKALDECIAKHGDAFFEKDGGLFDHERFIVVSAPIWE